MRFYNPADESTLTSMVAGGAISRDALEKAVGDRAVSLIEALVEHHAVLQDKPWLAWGVRQGLTRVNGTKVSSAFIRDLKLSSETLKALTAAWLFPFARNIYGQFLVATVPGNEIDPVQATHFGTNPIYCVASLAELADLRAAYRAAQ